MKLPALAPTLAALTFSLKVSAQVVPAPPSPNAFGPPPPTGASAAPWLSPPAVIVNAEANEGLGAVPRARHAIYLGATNLILINGVGLNYSYRPFRGFAVSAGAGFASIDLNFSNSLAIGGQLMAHGLFGGSGSHSFEFAGGLSVVLTNNDFLCSGCGRGDRVAAFPSAFLGYRYHPMDGGFLVRGGLAWEFGLGIGVHLSLGWAF